MHTKRHSSIDKTVDIIFDAIVAEPYFSREVLKPKIRAIISGFRMDMNTVKYNKIETPSELARLKREHFIVSKESELWKRKFREIASDADIKSANNEIDALRKRLRNPEKDLE